MKQADLILDHLRTHDGITPMEALEKFGCFRLSGRIYDLKAQGYLIETQSETRNGKTYARYILHEPVQPELIHV